MIVQKKADPPCQGKTIMTMDMTRRSNSDSSNDSGNSSSSQNLPSKSKYLWVLVILAVLLCWSSIEQQVKYLQYNSIVQTAATSTMKTAATSTTKIAATTTAKNRSLLLEWKFDTDQVHSCPEIRTAEYNTSISDTAKHFQALPIDTWKLMQSSESQPGVVALEFQIQECPVMYAASTFHIQASTSTHLFTGTVGRRYRTEFGCGYYNASISLVHNDVGSPKPTCQNKTIPSHLPRITLELFWTSNYRNYHNQIHNRVNAFTIKGQNLNMDEIRSLVGQGRLDYLARHLDVLPGFPLDLELPVNAFVEDGTTAEASNNVSAASLSDNAKNNVVLPNCSEVPIEEWLPVGVRAPADGSPKTGTWQFVSPKCQYVEWNLEEDLYYWLSGLKILYLGDSHQGYELEELYQLVCPGEGPSDREHIGRFIGNGFECPQRNVSNPFIYGSRMFRGILNQGSILNKGTDTDGISKPMRDVQRNACQKFLGLGGHNVTIVMTPTWIFVYETEEALLEYVQSMKDTLIMCRGLYPTEFENHIILFQSPTAADVRPAPGKVPADMWRKNHNFREEAFTKTLYQELSPYVDGIIPAFEFTLARNWKLPTRDGIHLTGGYYMEIFHVQVAAIISAMKSRGWNLPLFAHDDPKARWFKKDLQATA